MKRRWTIFYVLLFGAGFLMSSCPVRAQDYHFSQYFNQPLYLNPAMTGLFEGDHRLAFIYRNQWNQLHRAYQNAGISFDTKYRDWAFGAQLLSLNAGEIGFTRNSLLLSASYDLLGKSESMHHLFAGVQVGFIQQGFDVSKVTTASQYTPGSGFDPQSSTMENFDRASQFDLDASVGLTWFKGSRNNRFNYFAGVSVAHLARPDISFLAETERMPIRYILHGGIKYNLNKYFSIIPQAMVYYEELAYANQFGANVNYALLQAKASLIAGVHYRSNDAVIPMVGVRYGNFTVNASYDATVSQLNNVSVNPGSFEISLIYVFRNSTYKPRFICPRL